MLTIAIANQKGGVGKTTTAVTLASAAQFYGRRALIVDADPQAQCATALGLSRADGLYRLLRAGVHLSVAAVPAREHLDLLPGDPDTTARLQDELVGDPWGHTALAEALDRAPYDLCVIDCPPTLGRLNVAALMAADLVVIPTTCNYFGLEAVGLYLRQFNDAKRRRGGPTAELAAIVPTFYDSRTLASREALDLLTDDYGQLVAAPIPRATIAERVVEEGKTLWELAPRSPVAIAYAHLVKWLYQDILS